MERIPTVEPATASGLPIQALTPALPMTSAGAAREIASPVSSSLSDITSPYMIGIPASKRHLRATDESPVPLMTMNNSLSTVAAAHKVSKVLGSSGFHTNWKSSIMRPLIPPAAFHFCTKTSQRSNKCFVVKVSGIEIPMARMASRSEIATPILMVSAVTPISDAVRSSVTGASVEGASVAVEGASVTIDSLSLPPHAATMSAELARTASIKRDFFILLPLGVRLNIGPFGDDKKKLAENERVSDGPSETPD